MFTLSICIFLLLLLSLNVFENKWTNGAATAVIDTAGNWSPTTPGANEAALFLAENSATSGPQGSAAVMDGLTALDLDLLKVGPGYNKPIGASGAPLQLSADLVWYRGTYLDGINHGKLWYADGDLTTDLFIVDSTAADGLGHDCVEILAGSGTGLISQLDVLRGKTTLSGGTVTIASCGRRNSNTPEAHLYIGSSVVISTHVELWGGGLVTCLVNPVLARVFAGTWLQSQGGAVITTLHVWGGTVILNQGGTYATVRHYGGGIDTTQQGGIKTITNYYKYPGAVLLGENDASCVSITNRFDFSGS